jgi:hypothetical protein
MLLTSRSALSFPCVSNLITNSANVSVGSKVKVVLSDDDGYNFNKSLTIYDGNEERRRDRRLRYWIHIADVDQWAPRGSELLRVAERRGTSLYLPHMTLNVFPEM